MGQENEITAMQMHTPRSGVSRKLLMRKALEKAEVPKGEPLEASFPPALSDPGEEPADALGASSSAPTAMPAQNPPVPAAWSSEDEAAFQALCTRRKAAGYQRRGRDLSTQLLQPGSIKPNANTIAATIVALVADRDEITRCELLNLMATASFPHPKAQPTDKGWCQGYVAGAIRSGFLSLVQSPHAHTETKD